MTLGKVLKKNPPFLKPAISLVVGFAIMLNLFLLVGITPVVPCSDKDPELISSKKFESISSSCCSEEYGIVSKSNHKTQSTQDETCCPDENTCQKSSCCRDLPPMIITSTFETQQRMISDMKNLIDTNSSLTEIFNIDHPPKA